MTDELSADSVREDSRLLPEEKETYFRFDKRDDRVFIHSGERGIMRRLLAHPEFEPRESTCIERDGHIVQVEGSLPIGCMKIGKNPRDSGHADVITQSVFS